MLVRPTLRQLQYLCEIADKQSFRGAAKACFVSQSTLSAGIKQLEEILQATLVDRDSPNFRLTVIGESVVARSRSLLRDVDELVADAQKQETPLSGRLRLGIIPSIGPFLLPQALPSLRKTYPELRLYLREALTRDVLEGIRAGRLDAGVIALPYRHEGLNFRSLGMDHFKVALPRAHALAGQVSLSLPQLKEETLILLEDGHCLRDHILSSLERGANSGDDIQATSLTTTVQMVANGLGVTLLPQIALDAGLVGGLEVAIGDLESPMAERELVIVWRPNSSQAQNVQLLADHLAEFVGD